MRSAPSSRSRFAIRNSPEEWHDAQRTLDGETLSVILPVYNLASTIAANLDEVAAVLDEGGISYELVPVDDGSSDETAKVLRE